MKPSRAQKSWVFSSHCRRILKARKFPYEVCSSLWRRTTKKQTLPQLSPQVSSAPQKLTRKKQSRKRSNLPVRQVQVSQRQWNYNLIRLSWTKPWKHSPCSKLCQCSWNSALCRKLMSRKRTSHFRLRSQITKLGSSCRPLSAKAISSHTSSCVTSKRCKSLGAN